MTVDDVPPGMLVVYCSECDEAVLESDTINHAHQPAVPDEEFWFLQPLGTPAATGGL